MNEYIGYDHVKLDRRLRRIGLRIPLSFTERNRKALAATTNNEELQKAHTEALKATDGHDTGKTNGILPRYKLNRTGK